MLGANCYVVLDSEEKEGYVIDPGGDAAAVVDAASDIEVIGILCTHGHMDHVGAAGKVAAATGAPVYVGREDSGALSGEARGLTARLGSLAISKPAGVQCIEAGQEFPFGDHVMTARPTPGHSPGSFSFLCENNLFCGDLVFQGSVGRTDLRGSSTRQLLESVEREVFTLPDDTRIFTGHGPPTTVGDEKSFNPFLRHLAGGD